MISPFFLSPFILFFLFSGSMLLVTAGLGVLERLFAPLVVLVAAACYLVPCRRRAGGGGVSCCGLRGPSARPLATLDAAAELEARLAAGELLERDAEVARSRIREQLAAVLRRQRELSKAGSEEAS